MKSMPLAMMLCLVFIAGTTAVLAQNYDCYEDTGNLCLEQCGVFAADDYDSANAYPNGNFTATAIYPQCTSTCSAHAIGVDYSTYTGYPCYIQQDSATAMRLKEIMGIAPGAPLYVATCTGELLPAVQPQPGAFTPFITAPVHFQSRPGLKLK